MHVARMPGFTAAFVVWLAAILTMGHGAAADRPSWQSLPDNTLFTARAPNLTGFVDAMKTRTKLGAIVTDEQRWTDFRKLLEDEAGEDWEKFTAGYEKIGLTPDVLWKSAAGEIGYAGLLVDDGTPIPGYVGLAWMQCGDEAAAKWLAALDAKLDEQEAGPNAIRREDLDLAGRKVIHLTIPSTAPKQGSLNLGVGVGTQGGLPLDAALQIADKAAAAERTEVAQTHVLVARRSDGLVFAHASVDVVRDDDTPAARTPAAVVDMIRSSFAAFLESHSGRDESNVQSWQQTAGLADALPEGETLVDVLVDTRRLAALLKQPEAEEVWTLVQAAGLDAVGPVGYRVVLDGTVLRSGLFASVPAPRQGLQTLLDQPATKPEPAPWVNNSVVGYQHIHCDLGKAYALIAQTVRTHFPRGQGALDTLETQSQAFLMTDPTTLLSALGRSHTILTYLPVVAADAEAREDDDSAQRTATAFVWLVPDEAIWRRLISLLAQAASKPLATEQGFTGLRYDEKELSGGWFIGNGYMLLAIGKGVTEKALSNLRSTPRNDEALRNMPHARRAAELLTPATSITYDLTDGAGLLNFADGVMRRAFADASDADAAKLKSIWPTREELQGTIGVSVSAVSVDVDGVTYRSILELPSP